jgi:hypothetical protein
MSWPVLCRYGSAKARNQDREHLIGSQGANGISLLVAKEGLGKGLKDCTRPSRDETQKGWMDSEVSSVKE